MSESRNGGSGGNTGVDAGRLFFLGELRRADRHIGGLRHCGCNHVRPEGSVRLNNAQVGMVGRGRDLGIRRVPGGLCALLRHAGDALSGENGFRRACGRRARPDLRHRLSDPLRGRSDHRHGQRPGRGGLQPPGGGALPDNKTVKLNQFHVWFPGGIVLGGAGSLRHWTAPGSRRGRSRSLSSSSRTAAYGVLLLGRRFPATEGVRSGVSMGEMFRATLGTPLMLLMLVCMAMTASLELGPNRWVPAVLEAGGNGGHPGARIP